MLFKNDLMENLPHFFVVLMPILCFLIKLSSNFTEDIRRSSSRSDGVYILRRWWILSMFVSFKNRIQVYNINIVLISCFYRNIFRCTKYCNNFEIEFNSNFFGTQKQTLWFCSRFEKNVRLNKGNTERFFVEKKYKSSFTRFGHILTWFTYSVWRTCR